MFCCFDIVENIVTKGPLVVVVVKCVIYMGYNLNLDIVLEMEIMVFGSFFVMDDLKEGM